MITKQEMFDRSWNGLAGQNWCLARNDGGACFYLTADGRRCAWGHVDPENTGDTELCGTVYGLRGRGIGLAATLDLNHFEFARELQRAHDTASTPAMLENNMRKLATVHGLTIPGAV